MQRYIGIDLGGTNIKGALVSETGKILKQRSVPTHTEAGAEAVTKTIAAMICALAEGESVSGVGMGCPGTVDDQEGTVGYACNLGWVHYDVRTALRELTGYSVRLVNDANAAALAEAAVGAAKGAQSAVVVTLGTGVGGGVVLNGKLLTGFTGAASELGHMTIVADGEPCACGQKGCFETYVSATALIRMTREAMAQHPQSALHRIAAENGGVDGRTAFWPGRWAMQQAARWSGSISTILPSASATSLTSSSQRWWRCPEVSLTRERTCWLPYERRSRSGNTVRRTPKNTPASSAAPWAMTPVSSARPCLRRTD